MKLAILAPFTPAALAEWIPELKNAPAPRGVGHPTLFELVPALIDRGHKVHVITLQPGLARSLTYAGDGTAVHIIPSRLRGAHRTFWNLERKMMVEVLRQLNPEVVHAHWTYEYGLAAVDYSPQRSLITAHDLPFDVLRYGRNPYYLPSFIATHYVYRHACWLSGVSPAVVTYAKRFVHKSTKIVVIPNAAPSSYAQTKCSTPNFPKPFIITLGSWNKYKNVATALKAFRRFRELGHPEYHYLLLGGGLGEGEEAQAWADQHELAENVHFSGKRPHGEALGHLARATVCLVPSKTEACSMAILEAMSLGVPTIGGDKCGGVPWVLDHGAAGCLTDIDNPEAIAASLARVVSDAPYREALVVRARAKVESEFSLGTVVSAYENAYQAILDQQLPAKY